MDESTEQTLGLTTRTALIKLKTDIRSVVVHYKKNNFSSYEVLKSIISFSSDKVLVSGVAYTIILLFITALIVAYLVGESTQAHYFLLWDALLLFVILTVNFIVAFNEESSYRDEIPHRVKKVLESLDKAINTCVWREKHYPHLCAPFSPCVILQWTYRDGMIVNLPWALLVEGDIIVLRPGQEVPGHCRGLGSDDPDLYFGQIYQPRAQNKSSLSAPQVRMPHQNKAYQMCETPYLQNLKVALEQATCRPVTVFEKQRYLWTVKVMEELALPIVVGVVTVVNIVRHVYQLPGVNHWTETYLLQTIAASLPILQIVFPIAWVGLNCYGLARFKLLSKKRQKYRRPKSCSISEDANDPLIQAISESNLGAESLRSLGKTFINIALGREDMVSRTANIVQVLGSLSALCCVDKKGILSWPNPTAEKVFFLRNSDPISRNSSKSSLEEAAVPQSQTKDLPVGGKNQEPITVAEVLDLTHDQNAPFCVEFDDQQWREHIARLKPLGLAALLNTCAPAPRHTYSHFCSHLTCEAQLSEDLVPVTNRRCLCELAKQIGFTESVAQNYTVEECLAVFRHLQPDTIRRDTRFARSLHLTTRVKVPLPHMLSVIVRDHAKQLQMLTQGTADLILDCCVDYWNGRDLTPISPADRKKIIDFYQRNSLTAYCTAFAYKPLTRGISNNIASLYLEVPADARRVQQWPPPPVLHFHSSDSLIFNEVTEDDVNDADGYFDLQCNQVFIGMVTMQYQAQSDMVELIERLERACIRFVHFSKENELRSRVFSEKMGLESGWNCHISLMNDDSKPSSPLLSQTVPAKTIPNNGGQTNTHITNAKDTTEYDVIALGFAYSGNISASKTLSMSAPGAINVEHNTVKFDSEIKKTRHSITNGFKMPRDSITDTQPSADTLVCDEEESPVDACRSLSCLTDSTEHSAPVHFDMSNRAKLPRGIENIRPHIEQVDNVPLLVSLFTDCTAGSVHKMVKIMQDYGEVVCVMGSAANCLNMEIFMQADASIAMEPLYPVLCQKLPPYQSPLHCIGPIDLARSLNAIPCSLSVNRDADVSLFALITMSRHYMMCVWNCTQFWMCSASLVAALQIISLTALLPSALSVGGSVWMSTIVVPALSASLVFAPVDASVMQRAAIRPSQRVNYKMALFVIWCYVCKFIPTLIAILCLYGFTLRSFCDQLTERGDLDCWLVYPQNRYTNTSENLYDDFYYGFYLAQHIALSLVTVHLIVISLSFVHRQQSIWQKGFWTNRVWCFTVVLLLLIQSLFSYVMLNTRYGDCDIKERCYFNYLLTWPIVTGYVLSPLIILCINELIKWLEIKADDRNQRRARLDFGTKLGMNSPF